MRTAPFAVWKLINNNIGILKSMKLKKAVPLGLTMCLMTLAFHTKVLAEGVVEEVVVYGQRVSPGFYEYTKNLMMNPLEFQSLYVSATQNHGGGVSPFSQFMIRWGQRCGGILGNLNHSYSTCTQLVGEHHLDMLESCDLRASGKSVDITVSAGHPFLGASLTWTAPNHEYAACSDVASTRRVNLDKACINGYNTAILKQTDCRGAYGDWSLKQ